MMSLIVPVLLLANGVAATSATSVEVGPLTCTSALSIESDIPSVERAIPAEVLGALGPFPSQFSRAEVLSKLRQTPHAEALYREFGATARSAAARGLLFLVFGEASLSLAKVSQAIIAVGRLEGADALKWLELIAVNERVIVDGFLVSVLGEAYADMAPTETIDALELKVRETLAVASVTAVEHAFADANVSSFLLTTLDRTSFPRARRQAVVALSQAPGFPTRAQVEVAIDRVPDEKERIWLRQAGGL